MQEVDIYLAELIHENKLSHKEAQFFVDFAYDLDLDGYDDEEIEFRVKSEIKQKLKEKKINAKLL